MKRDPGSLSVTVRREIAASAEELFDAWLDPASLAEWMRPFGITRTEATVNPRIGGTFEILMHRAAGLVSHSGEYKLIDRPRLLVFTWRSLGTKQADTLVTVAFHAGRGGRTEVVLTHEQLPDADVVSSHVSGWNRILDLLTQWAATSPG